MNLLRNVLVVIAATGAIGSAQAQNTFDLGTLDPTVKTRTDIFGAVAFADIFNFTVDASNSTVSSSTIALGPDGKVSSTAVTGLHLDLFSGFNAPVGTTPLFTGLNLDGALLSAGEFSARVAGTAGPLGGGFQFSIAANPEPAEWMLMLAGLVLLGFSARRKIGLVAAPA